MTANVITYRGRSAAREVGKALGLPGELQDRLASLVVDLGLPGSRPTSSRSHLAEAGCDPRHPRIRKFAALWTRLQDLPRHLGQHSGGMVIAAGRLDDVVPLEPATMPGRVVVQWDKDDCAALGIVKVDLLGLRMMSVLQDSIGLVRETGGHVDLAHLPPDDPEVYQIAAAGRHHRRVPGREPRPDGHAAADPSRAVLRPGGAGGDHPARARSWATWCIPTSGAGGAASP